jgi:hypothetical protein
MTTCKHCWGGKVKNPKALGRELAGKRTRAEVTLRELAEVMSLSPQYISDLERGRRVWTPSLEDAYLRGVNVAAGRKRAAA